MERPLRDTKRREAEEKRRGTTPAGGRQTERSRHIEEAKLEKKAPQAGGGRTKLPPQQRRQAGWGFVLMPVAGRTTQTASFDDPTPYHLAEPTGEVSKERFSWRSILK